MFSMTKLKKMPHCISDIPNFLEVDLMTLLIVTIYEPFLFIEYNPVYIYRVPFASMRLYN
jgi:hypothetical protein